MSASQNIATSSFEVSSNGNSAVGNDEERKDSAERPRRL